MPSRQDRILVLCKTYPSPSAKYAETSCVAGLTKDGVLIRLYPVPFRLIGDKRQFKKWQWISARVEKARDDRRPESYRLFVDTISRDPKALPTLHNWRERREWLSRVQIFETFEQLEAARRSDGITLALLRPSRILGLDVKAVNDPDWTKEEIAKLIQLQQQDVLFDKAEAKSVSMLRKLPFDFHYRYSCTTGSGRSEHRHKIVDWEVGALFWNVRRSHGKGWQVPFKAKLEGHLPAQDLMFLMGTIHRFPDQWLIVSLIYPPKQLSEQAQLPLKLGE
jgi:hypothetical protein